MTLFKQVWKHPLEELRADQHAVVHGVGHLFARRWKWLADDRGRRRDTRVELATLYDRHTSFSRFLILVFQPKPVIRKPDAVASVAERCQDFDEFRGRHARREHGRASTSQELTKWGRQQNPPGGRPVHSRLFHKPGEEAVLIADVCERSDRRLVPDRRVGLGLQPINIRRFGDVNFVRQIGIMKQSRSPVPGDFLGFERWPEPTTPARKRPAARRRQGLSIIEAARVLAVDPSTLWWWEHGRKPHRREHKERIAAFVGDGAVAPAEGADPDCETPPQTVDPISSLIRSRRRELGLSQEQTAAALGVNTWTVLLWEQGRYAPTPRFYPGLIRFLGCEPWPAPRSMSERLQAGRLRRGLTRKQLAGMLDVDLGSISKWKTGHEPHHRLSIAKVEAFLNSDPQPRKKPRRRQ